MKDSLFEKFMRLLNERFTQNTAETSSTAQSLQSFGELKNLAANTFFVRESRASSKRVLSIDEKIKLTKKSSTFLSQLLYLDIIGENTFELIMNQLCFSESGFVALEETKWTIHQTLADSLNVEQLAMLNLILYQYEEGVTQH